MSDEIPDPLAMMEQLLRGLVDVAKVTRTYYESLLDSGFGEQEAMQLTIAFQTQLQRGGME